MTTLYEAAVEAHADAFSRAYWKRRLAQLSDEEAHDIRKASRAAIAAYEAALSSRDMDAAPRDGADLLLWCDGTIHIGHFESEQDEIGQCGWFSDAGDWLGGICAPTHWRHLPAPPQE